VGQFELKLTTTQITKTFRIDPHEIVEWILADKLPVRFQLQMHKFIWTPTARGV